MLTKNTHKVYFFVYITQRVSSEQVKNEIKDHRTRTTTTN